MLGSSLPKSDTHNCINAVMDESVHLEEKSHLQKKKKNNQNFFLLFFDPACIQLFMG